MKKIMLYILIPVLSIMLGATVLAATITSKATGNWSSTSTWNPTTVPGSSDSVVLAAGYTVTVDGADSCAGLVFNGGATANGITISGSNSLTVTRTITMASPTASVSQTISVGSGTLTADSILIPGASTYGYNCILSVSTGTININHGISITGTAGQAQITFTGSGTLNIGGTVGGTGTFARSTGTVNYKGAGQTIVVWKYYNLTLSGSGTVTTGSIDTIFNNLAMSGSTSVTTAHSLKIIGNLSLSGTATLTQADPLTIVGNLNIGDGATFNAGDVWPFIVSGSTMIGGGTSGILNLTSSSAKTFTGDVTINANGTFNTGGHALTFGGNFSKSGTFNTGASDITFTGTGARSIDAFSTTGVIYISNTTGTFTLNGATSAASLDLTASTDVILSISSSLTLTNSLTISSAAGADQAATITGAGTISCAYLYVGSSVTPTSSQTTTLTSTIANLTTSSSFTLCGFVSGSYHNNPAFNHTSGTITVNGPLSSALSTGNTATYTMGSSNPTLNLGFATSPIQKSSTGTTTYILNTTGATINYNCAGDQGIGNYAYYNLTLSGSGNKTFPSDLTITSCLSISGTAKANLNSHTPTANTLTLGGTGQASGTWGSTASSATHKNDTYFYSSGGVVSVANTAAASLSGSLSVGPTGLYNSLTSAISALQSNGCGADVVFELQSSYSSTSETFPFNFGTYTGKGTYTVTVRPASGVSSALTISGSNATAILNLNAANKIVFDGRNGGTGSNKYLVIENTNTSAPAVTFINGSVNCAIQYCTVRASNTSASNGVILFSTDASGSGNDNNTISTCNIDCNGQSAFGIYSLGTSGRQNSGNSIADNNIYDFYRGSSGGTFTGGIYLYQYNTGWSITGNSIYQQTSRSYNTSSSSGIYGMYIDEGDGYTITGNYVGGSSATAGGTAWTISDGAVTMVALLLYFNNGVTTSSIQGNTVTNINMTSAITGTSAPFTGLQVRFAPANIGTVTPNVIGSSSTAGAIVIKQTGAAAGDYVTGAVIGNPAMTFSNNIIGGMSLDFNNSTNYGTFVGIYAYGAAHTISGNTIGSTTAANSIEHKGCTNTSTNYYLIGIEQDGNYPVTLSGNTVANLTMSSTGSKGVLQGIYTSVGTDTISGNTIRDLSTAAPNTATGLNSALSGIVDTSSQPSQVVSGNTIYNLSTTHASSITYGQGIYLSIGSSTSSVVRKNKIYGLTTSSSNTSSQLSGILIASGSGAVALSNNMVSLGNGLTTAVGLTGINVSQSAGCSFFFNTVNIMGSNVGAGGTSSQAFGRTVSQTDDIRNNIFINARSNGGSGTQKHYAINLVATTLTSNYNLLYASGTGGLIGTKDGGTTDYSSLANWKTGTSLDANSKSAAVTFVDAANGDLHLSGGSIGDAANLIAQTGTGVTDDFDGNTRNSSYPYKGADENTGSVLPVELTSFKAECRMHCVQLQWQTATEVNNYGFEVERRKVVKSLSSGVHESMQWTKIGFAQGNGTSNAQHNYFFTDEKLSTGKYAYRLKQIDNSGAFKYSQEAEVSVEVPKIFTLSQNYPNPFNPTTTIEFTLPANGRATLKVYDILGREIATLIDQELQAGMIQQTTFNASEFSSGIYFLHLRFGNQNLTKRMLLIK